MDAWILTLCFLAGAGLGLAYFGGLWLTVQRITRVERPYSMLVASFAVRMAMLLAAFYLILQGDWRKLVVCLAGFITARIVLIRRLRPLPTTGPQGPDDE